MFAESSFPEGAAPAAQSGASAASAGASSGAAAAGAPPEKRRREIYTYEAPWTIYGLAASQRPEPEFAFRFAVGSFIEEYTNKVQVVQLDDEKGDFVVRGTFDHPYPTTKIAWAPEPLCREKDFIATTGDYLRLWNVAGEQDIRLEVTMNNNKNSDYCAPLTSFDWNFSEPSLIGTASIDTTVTIWDIVVRKPRTQLIAHDKEVYDIAWARGKDLFATVGADGSVRMFDLRSLEHSTILYETSGGSPLLRLAWNRLDNNYIATFSNDSHRVVILDVRMSPVPVAELGGHVAAVNGIAWAPHSAGHICTAGDDYQALIWDLQPMPKAVEDPILAYTAEAEINTLVWSPAAQDWVTIAFDTKMQLLRV